MKVRYVLFNKADARPGEFEFLCHNQMNWSSSLEKVQKELEEYVIEQMQLYDPPLSRKEALKECDYQILKLTIENVT